MATAVRAPDRAPEQVLGRGSRPGLRPRTVVVLFTGLSLLFGAVFAAVVPAAWGPDESSHFKRAYQVSQGGLAPERLPDDGPYPVYGGSVPVAAAQLMTGHGGPPRTKERGSDPLFVPSEARDRALADLVRKAAEA